jgi:hypothetical protein
LQEIHAWEAFSIAKKTFRVRVTVYVEMNFDLRCGLRQGGIDLFKQALGLGLLCGGAALVVLEVAQGGAGVGLGALQQVALAGRGGTVYVEMNFDVRCSLRQGGVDLFEQAVCVEMNFDLRCGLRQGGIDLFKQALG